MPRRLTEPNVFGGTTDHADVIGSLRSRGAQAESGADKIMLNLAADLLQAHDETGISLDDWPWASRSVEMLDSGPIIPSLV